MATRNAGDVPVKAWARTLPSVAWVAGGVGADPGDAVEGGAADLPARGVEFEADGAAEFVEGEVDGAGVVAGGGGDLGDVAPAGGAGGAVEVFFAEGGVIVRIVERITAAGHGRSCGSGAGRPCRYGAGPRHGGAGACLDCWWPSPVTAACCRRAAQ